MVVLVRKGQEVALASQQYLWDHGRDHAGWRVDVVSIWQGESEPNIGQVLGSEIA
jgi:hypothetical protein